MPSCNHSENVVNNRISIVCAADPIAKQSYSRITDEQANRASLVVQQVSDGSPMRNGDGEAGDDSRRGSVCKSNTLRSICQIAQHSSRKRVKQSKKNVKSHFFY